MVSYTNSLSGGLIQPSNMSYVAYRLEEDLRLAWPSTFGNNPKVMDFSVASRLEATQ